MNRLQFAEPAAVRGYDSRSFLAVAIKAWCRLAEHVDAAIRRQRQRHALGRLDERLLRDVGITPDQASEEAGKPPWRP